MAKHHIFLSTNGEMSPEDKKKLREHIKERAFCLMGNVLYLEPTKDDSENEEATKDE